MNPLIWKIGIPATILAVLAFMRYTNKKTMGEPFFPGVGTDKQNGGGGGAGIGLLNFAKSLGGQDESLTSPNEVIDSGTFEETSDSGTSSTADASDTSGSNMAVSSSVTGAGAGSGVAGSSLPALRGGIGIGGVVQPSQPVASAIIQNTVVNPYTGGYQPYSPTPVTVPVSNQFGGQGGGGVFAM